MIKVVMAWDGCLAVPGGPGVGALSRLSTKFESKALRTGDAMFWLIHVQEPRCAPLAVTHSLLLLCAVCIKKTVFPKWEFGIHVVSHL